MEQKNNASKTTRRQFMKTGAAAAAAVTFASGPAIHGQDKSGSKNTIIGSGEYKYECIHDWGMDSLPSGVSYGNASHGVTFDKEGMIYISHQGGPESIFVFDPNGKFVKGIDAKHKGSGHGLDIREEGGEEFFYVSPSNGGMSFTKLDKKGEIVWEIGKKEINEASGGLYDKVKAYRPTNISFSPDGGFFLGDGYGSNYIHQYDKDAKYIRSIGGGGNKDGQFKTPHGQWLDERDGTAKLVVADRANKRLQWFTMDGEHVKTLDGFLFPADIDVQKDLMLVPDLHARITILDKDNKVVAQLGDDEEWRKQALAGFKMRGQRDKWQPGKFIHPHDAAFDADGNIFCVEWVKTGRVTKLVKV